MNLPDKRKIVHNSFWNLRFSGLFQLQDYINELRYNSQSHYYHWMMLQLSSFKAYFQHCIFVVRSSTNMYGFVWCFMCQKEWAKSHDVASKNKDELTPSIISVPLCSLFFYKKSKLQNSITQILYVTQRLIVLRNESMDLGFEIKQDRVVNSSGSKMVNFHRTEASLT